MQINYYGIIVIYLGNNFINKNLNIFEQVIFF